MIKVALVTNELSPYRTPVFSELSRMPNIDVHVIACVEIEPNRLWDYPPLSCGVTILRRRCITFRGRFIHNNIDVLSALARYKPDVIITDGFNPTHLYAFFYALFKRLPHVSMTDGTDFSEQVLTVAHKALRRLVYAKSKAVVCASEGGNKLFDHYRVPNERRFKSCLCVNNANFLTPVSPSEKEFDFMFCGRIETVKNPLFVLKVAAHVAQRMQRKIKVLFVGSGSKENEVKKAALSFSDLIEVKFAGFAAQRDLPPLYRSARIFLFPTLWDPWGVVVNEACAAGLPIITSPFAGAANELVLDGENGYVCELDLDLWVDKAVHLLSQPAIEQQFSERSRQLVRHYNFQNAGAGLADACYLAGSKAA